MRSLFFSLLFSLLSACASGEFFLFHKEDLKELQRRVSQHDPIFERAVGELLFEANLTLSEGPFSVLEKTGVPPSKDKHDYMSLARYYWPNSFKPNGIPYICRDGYENPEIWSGTYDYGHLNKMQLGCINLSWAYFLTGNEAYAKHAVTLVRSWFLDEATRMNPHLKYAQGIPGSYSGRFKGIIETSRFPILFDSITLLSTSEFWTDQDAEKLSKWAQEYVKWLLESPFGCEESKSKNNHGSWYDFQVIYFALYTGQKEVARKRILEHTLPKLQTQFTPEGAQPLELARSRSFHYSIYNLHALFHCALVAEHLDIDLWERHSNHKATLQKGLDWVLEYVKKETWVKEDIEPMDKAIIAPLLLIASPAYQDPQYVNLYCEMLGESMPSERLRLTYPRVFLRK